MSIDYTSTAAFGLILDYDYRDKLVDLAVELGYDLEGYSREEADFYDAIKVVADNFGLKIFEAGDSYSGDCEYLIGEGVNNWHFGWTKVLPPSRTLADEAAIKLQKLRVALDIDEEPAWYAGLHVW